MIAALARARLARVAACALALPLLLALAPAFARGGEGTPPASTPAPPRVRFLPGTSVRESDLPLYFSPMALPDPPRSQRPAPPLEPRQALRLRRAADLRAAGQLAAARESLLVLDRELPHHPLVVGELARVDLARGEHAAVVSRLRTERAALRDSVLGAHELVQALERLAKPRDATQVALECWSASPVDAEWAEETVLRLAPLDPRGVTERLRAVVAARPSRGDLLDGLALLLSRQGQPAEAARVLSESDRRPWLGSARRRFAEQAVATGLPVDSAAAVEALLSLAGDASADPLSRTTAARRAIELADAGGHLTDACSRVATALEALPPASWDGLLLLDVARGLREGGQSARASALLARVPAGLAALPQVELERCLALLRQGPPARAVPALDSLARRWPDARFMLAEAQFFAGEDDSALANYQRVADVPDAPEAMSALERTYLIEEHPGAPELRTLGDVAYARWREDVVHERALADSLWRALPRTSPFVATAALQSGDVHARTGDWKGALEPLVFVADSLPDDRLAPVARQRAGEAWLALHDERRAQAQFEECLVRYPKAWNSAEVRRRLEQLRRRRPL